MRFNSKALALAFGIVSLMLLTGMVSPIRAAELRGFGNVTESPLANGAGIRFDCDSDAHAVLLIQKLAHDMALSATVPSQWVDVVVGGRTAPVLARPGVGAYLVLAKGETAYCFTAPLAPGQQAAGLSFPAAAPLIAGAMLYDPKYTYPMYLDKWSTRGIGSWYPYPWGDKYTKGYTNTIDDHFTFAKKFDLTIQPNRGGSVLDNLLPKIHQYGLAYHFAQWMDWNPSLAILDPESLFQGSPLFTYATNYYGQVSFGAHKLEQYRNWEWVQSVKKYVTDPNLVDWLDPNGELGAADLMIPWDYTEDSRGNLVHWLRDVRGYTLASLGIAWYGDSKRFSAWQNVTIPKNYDFYGYKTGDILADKPWRLHSGSLAAGLKLGYEDKSFADKDWVDFQMPGGEVPAIEWQANVSTWYRGSISISAHWLKQASAAGRVYLTIASLSASRGLAGPDRVWVNGVELGGVSVQPGGPITGQMDVTSVVHAGRNTIVYLPSNPPTGIPGFFYLTTAPLQSYPFADTHLNARYSDWQRYCDWAARAREEGTLKAIRGMDPNRPIKVMAILGQEDIYQSLIAKYGAYPHHTGNGGFMVAWDKRFGYLWGNPASAELGGPFVDPSDADALKRYFGFFTFQGINAFDQFHDIQDMMYHPVLSDLWAKYLPYFHVANRYDLKKPDILIFNSLLNNRLLAQSPTYAFDLGRGDLQSIGYSYAYIDETGLAAGLAKSYPVIWDAGTEVMSPKTVAYLKAYVENGGTYVAIQDTGRDTFTQRDAWPISALTGFKVRQIRPMTGAVTILNSQSLFTKLAGDTFYNRGKSIDYSDFNYADKCLALERIAPNTTAIARYQDGSIAIGMRCLGKGRVIVLGSPFWRDSYDKMGYWHPGDGQSDFLTDMLAGLGLKPLCTSDNRMIWRENYLANNGTEEYLALWNQTDQPQTANLYWTAVGPVAGLYDVKDGTAIPCTINGGNVAVKSLTLAPYEVLLLATQWQRSPEASVSDWYSHLALWWRASAPGEAALRPDLPLYQIPATSGVDAAVIPAADAKNIDLAAVSNGIGKGLSWRSDLAFVAPKNRSVAVDSDGRVFYRWTVHLPEGWSEGSRYFLEFTPTIGNQALRLGVAMNGHSLSDINIYGQDATRIEISSALKFGGSNVVAVSAPSTGFLGSMVIDREPPVADSMSVAGNFLVQETEDSGLIPVKLPGTFNGLFATKSDIIVPKSWQGSRVFMRLSIPTISQYAAFVINDKIVFHPITAGYNQVTYMDITPWIHFGSANRLLLLTAAAARSWTPGPLDVEEITLERVAKR